MSIGSNICKNGHGPEYIDWKCMFCCSVALFNCNGGGLWFCDRCHNEGGKVIRDCGGKNCPLKLPHPPASNDFKKSAFPLGCSLCRSDHLVEYDEAQEAIRALLEEDPFAFENADRSLHSTAIVLSKKGGKKKGKKGKSKKQLQEEAEREALAKRMRIRRAAQRVAYEAAAKKAE